MFFSSNDDIEGDKQYKQYPIQDGMSIYFQRDENNILWLCIMFNNGTGIRAVCSKENSKSLLKGLSSVLQDKDLIE